MLNQLNHDILCHLSNYFLLFDSLINLSSSCEYLYNNIYLINLCDIEYKYLRKLTDTILKQQKYIRVRYLHAFKNSKITTIGHMRQLRELRCSRDSGINQDGIRELVIAYDFYETVIEIAKKNNIIKTIMEIRCSRDSG